MWLWLNFQAYLYSSAEVSGIYRHQSQNWFIFESQTFVPCWLGSICCLGLLCFSSFPCSWQQLHTPNNEEVDKMQGDSKIQYFQMHQQIPRTYPIHDLKRKNGWLNLDLSKTSAVSVLTVWWPKGNVRKCNYLKSVVQENNPISELQKTGIFFLVLRELHEWDHQFWPGLLGYCGDVICATVGITTWNLTTCSSKVAFLLLYSDDFFFH